MPAENKPGRLADRVALITGAGRGIGRAIAVAFAREGADLFLMATTMKNLEETRNLAAEAGRKIELYAADVSDRPAMQAMVKKALEVFGRIDILVNNAGVYLPKRFVDYSYEEFDRIMKVNVYGTFNVTQFVLPHMLERKYGKIVNMASTAGKWASMNQSAYNTSKHGVVGMTRCVALETAASGITVNAICPGVVETDMAQTFAPGHAKILGISEADVMGWVMQRIPQRRFLKPEEIAHLAVYLASSESDGMTGQSILVDGGMLFV
ncbi:MAG: SDR family oxidoreductase [Pseudomonadota bacterium]